MFDIIQRKNRKCPSFSESLASHWPKLDYLPISEAITAMANENSLGQIKHTVKTGLELALRHKTEEGKVRYLNGNGFYCGKGVNECCIDNF